MFVVNTVCIMIVSCAIFCGFVCIGLLIYFGLKGTIRNQQISQERDNKIVTELVERVKKSSSRIGCRPDLDDDHNDNPTSDEEDENDPFVKKETSQNKRKKRD